MKMDHKDHIQTWKKHLISSTQSSLYSIAPNVKDQIDNISSIILN